MGYRRWLIVSVAAATVLGSSGVASADAGHTLAVWEMNERSGARVMRDGSGHDMDGRIGRDVGTGGGYYRFERLEPDTPPTHPGHLALVDDDRDLDPGSRDFAIALRLRTRDSFGNIVQKGQATVAGGSYKLQIPSGKVQCWFRGSAGSVLVTAPRAINDGRWHTVRCERSRSGVTLSIDGRTVARRGGWTGSIGNSWPLSIGGKTDCDQIDVGCDYFSGDIDYVAVIADDHAW